MIRFTLFITTILVIITLVVVTYDFTYRIAYRTGYDEGGMNGVRMTKTEFYENTVRIHNKCANKIGSYTIRDNVCDENHCINLRIYYAEDFWP